MMKTMFVIFRICSWTPGQKSTSLQCPPCAWSDSWPFSSCLNVFSLETPKWWSNGFQRKNVPTTKPMKMLKIKIFKKKKKKRLFYLRHLVFQVNFVAFTPASSKSFCPNMQPSLGASIGCWDAFNLWLSSPSNMALSDFKKELDRNQFPGFYKKWPRSVTTYKWHPIFFHRATSCAIAGAPDASGPCWVRPSRFWRTRSATAAPLRRTGSCFRLRNGGLKTNLAGKKKGSYII